MTLLAHSYRQVLVNKKGGVSPQMRGTVGLALFDVGDLIVSSAKFFGTGDSKDVTDVVGPFRWLCTGTTQRVRTRDSSGYPAR